MQGPDTTPGASKEKPFSGTKVYYSASSGSTSEKDPDLVERLAEYMKEQGATILCEHVAFPHKVEKYKAALAAKLEISLAEFLRLEQTDRTALGLKIYQNDMKMVDQATHFLAIVNNPSHGVGLEIQRALDKPSLGLNVTPILFLVRADVLPNVSYMVLGAAKMHPNCQVKPYTSLEEAQGAVKEFLS